MQMDIREIMEALPHRYPFLLVDRVLELVPSQRIVAQKNVSMNEHFFSGHFPQFPVMPGVLIIEALAQAAGILSFKSMEEKKAPGEQIYLFAGIDGARFKRPVVPGDVLTLDVTMDKYTMGVWKYTAKAMVDGQLAAEAKLMSAARSVPPVGPQDSQGSQGAQA